MADEILTPRRVRAGVAISTLLMLLLLGMVVTVNQQTLGRAAFHSNTNLLAPFSVGGFLAACAGLVLAAIVVLCARAWRQRALARGMMAIALTGMVLYFGLLAGYSLSSKQTALAPGVEKYFCEIDCHLAYSVVSVRKDVTPVAGHEAWAVIVRTRFDEKTIAPWRGNSPLAPNPRRVMLEDSAGNMYLPHTVEGKPLATPLRPGDSYTTQFIFDLPAGAHDPKLVLESADGFPAQLLIGNENSFLHKKTAFRLM